MLSTLIMLSIEDTELLGLDLFNADDFWQFILRFIINSFWIFIVAYFLYYRNRGKKEFLFTYLLISAVVFEICILLDVVSLQLGFALGLFAVFGIIRYRTNPIPPREMTYLFMIIGISVKNALANDKISYIELIVADLLIISLAFIAERFLIRKKFIKKELIYNRLDLIQPENYNELLEDVSNILGFEVNKVKIGRIDMIKTQVRIYAYFSADLVMHESEEE
jgi:magnesium-transporting ATPase (P-type)